MILSWKCQIRVFFCNIFRYTNPLKGLWISILLFANVRMFVRTLTSSFLNRFQYFAYVRTPYGSRMLEKIIGAFLCLKQTKNIEKKILVKSSVIPNICLCLSVCPNTFVTQLLLHLSTILNASYI